MNEITIRNMQTKDLDQVEILGSCEESFRVDKSGEVFWSRKVLEDLVKSSSDISLVAECSEKVAGFLIMTYHQPTRKVTFENLCVDPKYRRNSAGTKLYQTAENRARQMGAHFICCYLELDNEQIINCLEQVGFKRGRKYYWTNKFLDP